MAESHSVVPLTFLSPEALAEAVAGLSAEQKRTATSLADTQGVLKEIASGVTARAQRLRGLEQEVEELRAAVRTSRLIAWGALAAGALAVIVAMVR